MKVYYFIIGVLGLLLCGCVKEAEEGNYHYRLVVEGWIEEGDVPYVILSQNKPLISTIDSTGIEDMVIRWAKVSVSDGETTEILRGYIDGDYFPPFVYRGKEMTGVAGKTYTLTVEYSGRIWTAQTTIPRSIALASLTTEAVEGRDTLYSVRAIFQDPPGEKNYYKFFSRILHKNGRYLPSLMGNLDDNRFDGQEMEVVVNQGIEMKEIKKFNAYFHIKDTVFIKFCTMSEFDFDFWTAYENEQINSQNPLFPANQNLPSNISGGRGCWCGFGRNIYVLWKGMEKKNLPISDREISEVFQDQES